MQSVAPPWQLRCRRVLHPPRLPGRLNLQQPVLMPSPAAAGLLCSHQQGLGQGQEQRGLQALSLQLGGCRGLGPTLAVEEQLLPLACPAPWAAAGCCCHASGGQLKTGH